MTNNHMIGFRMIPGAETNATTTATRRAAETGDGGRTHDGTDHNLLHDSPLGPKP